LHSQNKPQLTEGTISFSNTNNQRNGKLINTVLLPALNNQSVEIVGGEGKEYWVDGKTGAP